MSVTNKYIDIIINNDNTFYIVESSSKPQANDSVMTILAKIEFIVKNKLWYDPNHYNEVYSNQTQSNLFEILGKKSSQIHQAYKEKQSNVNWLAIKIFGNENQIFAIDTRIQDYINPPQILPLPHELIQEIAKHLYVSDLGILAQLNRHGKANAATAISTKARKFGYEGLDSTEAAKYLEKLFKEVCEFATQGVIPIKYLSYKQKTFFREKFDSERILYNLQKLSTEELFNILSNEKLYSPSFQSFIKIFNPRGSWKVIKVDSNTLELKGSGALILAVKEGNLETLELLLQHGANINTRDQDGRTPLALATMEGKTEVVRLLIRNGADVNTVNVRGNTPLIHSRSTEISQLLLEAGATATIEHLSNHASVGNALHYAVRKKIFEVVELLLQHGANINARDQDGRTPLALAAILGKTEVVRLLIRNGADVNTVNVRGNTPLIHSRSTEISRLLLEAGATATIEHLSNHAELGNALHVAVRRGTLEIIELLLQHGANINARDQDGRTPLALATILGKTEVVRLLIRNEADVNTVNVRGNTPLIHSRCTEISRLLLEAGATATIEHLSNHAELGNALHVAVRRGTLEIVELLLQHGANINARDQDGRTPLTLAIRHKNRKTKNLLLLNGAVI